MDLSKFNLPQYVLSFDPGGSGKTWAYAISTIKVRSNRNYFVPVEWGFIPPIEDIAKPDIKHIIEIKRTLTEKYPNVRMDLVAERFVGRGFTSWLAEYIAFELGCWCSLWDRGQIRFIMASQWKRMLEKRVDLKPTLKRYDSWWEEFWMDYTSVDEQHQGIVHTQDALAIGFWYFRYELGVNCTPEGIKDVR